MIGSSPILTENPIWESQRGDLSTVGWINAHFSLEVPLKCRHVRLDDMMRAIAEYSVDVTKGTANPVTLTIFARPCPRFFLDAIPHIIFVQLLLHGGDAESMGRPTSTAPAKATAQTLSKSRSVAVNNRVRQVENKVRRNVGCWVMDNEFQKLEM